MNNYVHCHAIHEVTFFRRSTSSTNGILRYVSMEQKLLISKLLVFSFAYFEVQRFAKKKRTILHLKNNPFTQYTKPKSYINASLTMFLSDNSKTKSPSIWIVKGNRNLHVVDFRYSRRSIWPQEKTNGQIFSISIPIEHDS